MFYYHNPKGAPMDTQAQMQAIVDKLGGAGKEPQPLRSTDTDPARGASQAVNAFDNPCTSP